MDSWVLNLKSGSLVFKAKTKKGGVFEHINGSNSFGLDSNRISEFRVRKMSSMCRSLVVMAVGKKKNRDDHFNSGNDGDNSKSDDSTHESQHPLLDWRDFRADLVARGHELLESTDTPKGIVSPKPSSQKLGPKWAHPIAIPEPGCLLVATEKLDGVRSFERSVVLLLRLGTRDPREGPFGVIINRPLHKQIKQMNPSNPDLATTFAKCSLHFGGPLDTSMFLFKNGGNSIPGFEEVVPGVSFGARNSLEEAAGLVKKGVLKAEDFRFFVGYAGWEFDQLSNEIANNYWVVSACSSYLINGSVSADGLWEEILQLMGGQYSELSRKPKQDSS